MKANELRIGNYVKHPRNDFAMVESIQKSAQGLYALTFKDEAAGYWIEHNGESICEGIEITEKVLLRFGFEVNKDGVYIVEINDVQSLLGNIDGIGFNIALDEYSEILGKNETLIGFKTVNHVHQLQNLYFALNGEELKLSNK